MPKVFTDDSSTLKPASLVRRLAAMVYDFMIVVAIWMVVGAIAVALNDGEAIASGTDEALLKSTLLVVTYLFFAYCWTRSGQTLGMLAWRLRVQHVEGRTLNWTESLIRFFSAGISFACLGLGYWAMLISDERLTWHDRWSNSTVVTLPKHKKD